MHDVTVFAAGTAFGSLVFGPSVFGLFLRFAVPWLAKKAGGV